MELTYDPAISLLGRYRRELKICLHKKLYTNNHNIIVYNSQMWKQPKCPSADKLISEIWFICTMDYHSAPPKYKDEVLKHATTWMNLENITLSERNQTKQSHVT